MMSMKAPGRRTSTSPQSMNKNKHVATHQQPQPQQQQPMPQVVAQHHQQVATNSSSSSISEIEFNHLEEDLEEIKYLDALLPSLNPSDLASLFDLDLLGGGGSGVGNSVPNSAPQPVIDARMWAESFGVTPRPPVTSMPSLPAAVAPPPTPPVVTSQCLINPLTGEMEDVNNQTGGPPAKEEKKPSHSDEINALLSSAMASTAASGANPPKQNKVTGRVTKERKTAAAGAVNRNKMAKDVKQKLAGVVVDGVTGIGNSSEGIYLTFFRSEWILTLCFSLQCHRTI